MRGSAILLLLLHTAWAEQSVCPESTQTAYFVIDNTELTTEETLEYKDFSEEECQSTCSSNIDANGRSLECASFAYDHVSFTCTVYATRAFPGGKGASKHSVGKRYFEKYCLPKGVPSSCAEAQFIRADDSVLIGFAANVSLVDTIEDCVAVCVKEGTCKSAMYFYEEGECITNTESALSKPASFAREDSEKVIYFQNGCMTRSSFVEASSSVGHGVESVDFESNKKDELKSAELPDSAEELVEEEEPSTIPSVKKTTKKAKGEEEYDDEDFNDEVTKKPKVDGKKNDLKKYAKHPKNFGSKTIHYKTKKGEKVGVSKVQPDEEEVAPSALPDSVDSDTQEQPMDPYTTFFSEWSDWTPCKRAGERRIRRRKCVDLRRCLGALMQVENCPVSTTVAPVLLKEEELKSEKSIVAAPLEGDPLAGIDTVTSSPSIDAEIASADSPDVGDGYIWSPWLGSCQKFASGQPCNGGEMIGFESRECVAKDPSQCQGPFFRYCTLQC